MKLVRQCTLQIVVFVSRLHLDAGLYEIPKPKAPGQMGRPQIKGESREDY